MNNKIPLVSIIIPVFESHQFITTTVRSVIAQTYDSIECLIVDDGSSSSYSELLHTFPSLKYIRQSHQGNAAARNNGISVAQGTYISFLDHDDLFTPQKIEHQVKYLEAHPQADVVSGLTQEFLEPNTVMPEWVRMRDLQPHKGTSPGTLLVRRELFEKIGFFDTNYTSTSDTEWLYRLKKANILVHFIPEVVLHKRIHATNQSNRLSTSDVTTYHHELTRIFRRKSDETTTH